MHKTKGWWLFAALLAICLTLWVSFFYDEVEFHTISNHGDGPRTN